ncbi:MAG: transporter related protein [Streptosporangiaceae bacterium]|nr:transporter related protein [Streptosporangiaceae bacterium]
MSESDRLLLATARHTRGWACALGAVAVGQAAAETLLPATLGRAVDAAIYGNAEGLTWPLLFAALVTFVAGGDIVVQLAGGASAAQATAWLRHRLVGHVLMVGARPRLPAGEIAGRMVTGTADAGFGAGAVIQAAAAVVPPVGSLIALALIDPWLALAFAAGLPFIALLLRAFVRDTSAIVTRYLRTQGIIAARLVDAIRGSRTIAAAGTAAQEEDRILKGLPELAEHGHATWRVQAGVASRGVLALPLLQVAVLAVAGLELSAGRVTPGQMLAAAQYAGLGAGIGPVITHLGRLARARAGAQRLVEILAQPALRYGTRVLAGGDGRLEFRGVTAGGVLDGVDLVVPGGSALAVVGRSGAGKSLLAALAGRLAEPESGEVLLDGVPLASLKRRELRRAVGYAFERPALFGHTVAEAIGFGPVPAATDRVREAAEAARADTFIRRLPEGYGTALADTPMSGGERQRIGLARAFAHPGRVLLLDDATSSLDTVTELQVSQALFGDLAGRTRVIMAHRAATAARADLVAWLDQGRIRACGPHHDLWRDAAYRSVFQSDDAS